MVKKENSPSPSAVGNKNNKKGQVKVFKKEIDKRRSKRQKLLPRNDFIEYRCIRINEGASTSEGNQDTTEQAFIVEANDSAEELSQIKQEILEAFDLDDIVKHSNENASSDNPVFDLLNVKQETCEELDLEVNPSDMAELEDCEADTQNTKQESVEQSEIEINPYSIGIAEAENCEAALSTKQEPVEEPELEFNPLNIAESEDSEADTQNNEHQQVQESQPNSLLKRKQSQDSTKHPSAVEEKRKKVERANKRQSKCNKRNRKTKNLGTEFCTGSDLSNSSNEESSTSMSGINQDDPGWENILQFKILGSKLKQKCDSQWKEFEKFVESRKKLNLISNSQSEEFALFLSLQAENKSLNDEVSSPSVILPDIDDLPAAAVNQKSPEDSSIITGQTFFIGANNAVDELSNIKEETPELSLNIEEELRNDSNSELTSNKQVCDIPNSKRKTRLELENIDEELRNDSNSEPTSNKQVCDVPNSKQKNHVELQEISPFDITDDSDVDYSPNLDDLEEEDEEEEEEEPISQPLRSRKSKKQTDLPTRAKEKTASRSDPQLAEFVQKFKEKRLELAMNEPDVINQLQKNPFLSLVFQDKLTIVKNGRPCPPLESLTTLVKTKDRTYTRHFTVSHYDYYYWMCGSHSRQRLFCWPCLLFSKASNVWVSIGFSNLSGLSRSAKTHENSKVHLQCVMNLYHLSKQIVDEAFDTTSETIITLHNQKVKKNREVLKRLIDVTCFLAMQELQFEEHEEEEKLLKKGNFIETVNLLTIWDPVLAEHFGSATETSTDFQNCLINSISGIINETILKEIEESDFVAMMFDELSDTKCGSQLSTVLRYVHGGDIKERFIKFSDVSADRTPEGLFCHVKSIAEKYNLADKLVAQTYDGAAVMLSHLSELQKEVTQEYPKALPVHCYAHGLNSVLVQGLNDIPECNLFFSTLNGIATFSSHSSKSSFAVQEYLSESVPSFAPTKSSFTSCLVNTIEGHLQSVINFFSMIISESNGEDKWNGPDRFAARGYFDFLNKFETVFLLNFFSPLFAQSDVISLMLQAEKVDFMKCLSCIKDFQQLLENFRNGVERCNDCQKKPPHQIVTEDRKCNECETVGFEPIWVKTISMSGLPEKLSKGQCEDCNDLSEKQRFQDLFFSILANLESHISSRFSSLQNLNFFELLNPQNYARFAQAAHFPDCDTYLESLERVYPRVFDILWLKNQLGVFYRSAIFRQKSPQNLLKFLKQENLDCPFREVFKLAKLICTMPVTTASTFKSCSALKRIQRYKQSMQGEERDIALLSIEKELLVSLRQKDGFYDNVIEKFASMTERNEYIYK